MPQLIQCPTCSKKFKLPDRPPATFTCTGCQTVMDLSGFREAPAPAAAAPAEVAAPARSSARSSSRASSGGSGSSKRRTGASTAARGRAARDDDDAEGEGGGRLPPPKKDNALIIGSLFGVVVLGGILLLVMKQKEPPPKPKTTAEATAPEGGATAGMTASPVGAPEAAMEEPAKPPPAPAFVPASKVQFHPIEHLADTPADEKQKIDDLIQKAVFENAGSDGVLAQDELVKFGVKAAPRLINVFSTVKLGAGFDDRMGKIQSSIADRVLRRIDGYIERSVKMDPVKPQSDPKFVERVARNWIAWWDNGKYKEPQKPWDERIDGAARDAAAMDDASGMTADGGSGGM